MFRKCFEFFIIFSRVLSVEAASWKQPAYCYAEAWLQVLVCEWFYLSSYHVRYKHDVVNTSKSAL